MTAAASISTGKANYLMSLAQQQSAADAQADAALAAQQAAAAAGSAGDCLD
jgi:hypothetical protein